MSFNVTSQSTYRSNLKRAKYEDEVGICFGDPESADYREFVIRWYRLDGRGPYARIEMFEDQWAVFARYPAFFKWLASMAETAPTVERFTIALLAAGLKDVTLKDTKGAAS
jgi:hypothetical protein